MLPLWGDQLLGSCPSPGAKAGALWIQTWVPHCKGRAGWELHLSNDNSSSHLQSRFNSLQSSVHTHQLMIIQPAEPPAPSTSFEKGKPGSREGKVLAQVLCTVPCALLQLQRDFDARACLCRCLI